MIFQRRCWGPQTVYQAEKPGVPASKKQKNMRRKSEEGHRKGGQKEKLPNEGLE